VASFSEKARVFKAGTSVGYRAAELGHQLGIQHEGKRFRVACGCGFRTGIKATRKAAFEDALNHAVGVVQGDIPALELDEATGVSPRISGGSA
jgi:hypothetical protein